MSGKDNSFSRSGRRGSSKEKPQSDSIKSVPQSGNAMIYVLVVVALFAALTFVLSRQNDTGEQGALGGEKVLVYANQIIQVSNQIKQGVDQMVYSGTGIGDLLFYEPGHVNFSSGTIHNVFHPDGGGVVMPRIPMEAVNDMAAPYVPGPGFFMGRFNNVEWTPTNATDVILVANQIREDICAKINESLTGSATIPQINVLSLPQALIDTVHHLGGNVDLTAARCPGCEGYAALCVANSDESAWAYYNIIEQR
jgi:hypothetical protein